MLITQVSLINSIILVSVEIHDFTVASNFVGYPHPAVSASWRRIALKYDALIELGSAHIETFLWIDHFSGLTLKFQFGHSERSKTEKHAVEDSLGVSMENDTVTLRFAAYWGCLRFISFWFPLWGNLLACVCTYFVLTEINFSIPLRWKNYLLYPQDATGLRLRIL